MGAEIMPAQEKLARKSKRSSQLRWLALSALLVLSCPSPLGTATSEVAGTIPSIRAETTLRLAPEGTLSPRTGRILKEIVKQAAEQPAHFVIAAAPIWLVAQSGRRALVRLGGSTAPRLSGVAAVAVEEMVGPAAGLGLFDHRRGRGDLGPSVPAHRLEPAAVDPAGYRTCAPSVQQEDQDPADHQDDAGDLDAVRPLVEQEDRGREGEQQLDLTERAHIGGVLDGHRGEPAG